MKTPPVPHVVCCVHAEIHEAEKAQLRAELNQWKLTKEHQAAGWRDLRTELDTAKALLREADGLLRNSPVRNDSSEYFKRWQDSRDIYLLAGDPFVGFCNASYFDPNNGGGYCGLPMPCSAHPIRATPSTDSPVAGEPTDFERVAQLPSPSVGRRTGTEARDSEHRVVNPADAGESPAPLLIPPTPDNDLAPVCRCGSGAHPRRCETHPWRYGQHIAELSLEAMQEAQDELAAKVTALDKAVHLRWGDYDDSLKAAPPAPVAEPVPIPGAAGHDRHPFVPKGPGVGIRTRCKECDAIDPRSELSVHTKEPAK